MAKKDFHVKFLTLLHVATYGDTTVNSLSAAYLFSDKERSALSHRLSRYCTILGYLARRKEGKRYVYSITGKGLRYIFWKIRGYKKMDYFTAKATSKFIEIYTNSAITYSGKLADAYVNAVFKPVIK